MSAAKVITMIAIDAFDNPSLIENAKIKYKINLGGSI